MGKFGDYMNAVGTGVISHKEHMRNLHAANAHNEHPIGHRLKDLGLFDQENVVAYYKASGEPCPVPRFKIGQLIRRTNFQLEEIGEIFEPKPTNYADRAPWLYRLVRRGLVETHEQYVEYEPGRTALTEAEINRLGPQPLGTAPFYDNDLKLTPRFLDIFRGYLRRE